MFDAQTQFNFFRTPAVGRQQVFMRAVVGSLVLCAALGGSSIQAQEALQQGRANLFVSAAFAFQSAQQCGRVSANGYDHLSKTTYINQPLRGGDLVIGNMTASANGKQFAMNLEMSRERAGNLLRQHFSLP